MTAQAQSLAAAAAALAMPASAADPFTKLRQRYHKLCPDDRARAAAPQKEVPYEAMLHDAQTELSQIEALRKSATGRAAEILSDAANLASERVATLESLPRRFAAQERAYQRASKDLADARRAKHEASPDAIAAHLVECERIAAEQRQAVRRAEDVLDSVRGFRKRPVLPALATARASVERERALMRDLQRERDSRSDDVRALAEALEASG
jgi:hypothetical protein